MVIINASTPLCDRPSTLFVWPDILNLVIVVCQTPYGKPPGFGACSHQSVLVSALCSPHLERGEGPPAVRLGLRCLPDAKGPIGLCFPDLVDGGPLGRLQVVILTAGTGPENPDVGWAGPVNVAEIQSDGKWRAPRFGEHATRCYQIRSPTPQPGGQP